MADAAIVAVQVPPVPGNVPPLKVKGADNPDPTTVLDGKPPVFETVKVLSVDEPFVCKPKS